MNEQYSNIQSLPKVKTSKDIAVHTGKNLDEKGLKSLQKLLKKLEKAAKKSHEDSESSEASVEVWVGNESTEEWALYLDSMALQGALKGKHLLVFAGQVPGSTLLPVIAQHQVGLSSVTIFPEPVPTEIAISLLKALYKLMDNPARKSVLPQEELLWQSIEQALVKVPVDKRMSWAGLKYFQVHRL